MEATCKKNRNKFVELIVTFNFAEMSSIISTVFIAQNGYKYFGYNEQ